MAQTHAGLRAHMLVQEAMKATAERRLRALAAVDHVAARRVVFATAQRLSPEEAVYLSPDFDPGPEYDA